jgi:crossover junction endodeoxyribonuclease RuvC
VRILGIDPGSRQCGYGILELMGRKIVAAGADVIHINDKKPLPERLCILYSELKKILMEYTPDFAAIETIFFGKNIQSVFTLGHARGVVLLALAEQNLPIIEYSPREIKKAVVGNGNASKQQIRYMVAQILPLTKTNLTSDAADALAIALCHYNKNRFS